MARISALILTVAVAIGGNTPISNAQALDGTNAMTRAEAVQLLILSRIPNIPVVRNVGQFKDVQVGVWHEPYMLYAEKIGIVKADAYGYLYPGSIVSRVEFLKMLTWTFGLATDLPHSFVDVPNNSWYGQYAGLAWNTGLFNLGAYNRLEPTRPLTRAEAQRAIALYERLRKEQQLVRIDQQVTAQPAANPKVYTVVSTRRQNVALHQAAEEEPVSVPTSTPVLTPLTSRYELRIKVLQLVNDERARYGMEPLAYNAQLELSAQVYSDRMAEENFFGHTAPDGQTLRQRIAATGYYDRSFSPECRCVKGYALGENLARGQKTPEEVVRDWLNSPSHRDAILNPSYTDLGVGISAGIWVQHFGGVLLPS